MEDSAALFEEPATPEYALAVLRNSSAAARPDDPRFPRASFETTIADWRASLGGSGDASHLGENFNAMFRLNLSAGQWRGALEPTTQRTLGELCVFIARHARRPRIRPAKRWGLTDRAAGAFLTVRFLLTEAGANPWWIGPSSLLAPYASRYLNVFLNDLRRLAPGVLPEARMRFVSPGQKLMLALIAGTPAAGFGICSGRPWIAATGIVTAIGALAAIWYPHRQGLPAVHFGELKTFRDLAELLAASDAVADAHSRE